MISNEIIESAAKNDKEAICQIIKEYQSEIYSISYRIIKNQHDAEDITQEVFIKIFQKINTMRLQNVGSLEAWIRRITMNECYALIRKTKNKACLSFSEDTEELEKTFNTENNSDCYTDILPLEKVDKEESKKILFDIVSGLSEADKACVFMQI